MRQLALQTRVTILKCLLDGMSIRATARVADVSKNTVSKLLIEAGTVCAAFHDENVRGVKAERVQCDEIWSFVGCKQKNAMPESGEWRGDVWTWTAIDADSKLAISYLVGGRDGEYAIAFMDDLRSRLENRVQLTTDGHKAYLEAVEGAFGGDVDYAQLVKLYGEPAGGAKNKSERKYSPAECTGIKKNVVEGSPDKSKISTSYVERQNLTMRMAMRRFTRLTNAFSKKIENHAHAVALHFMNYNFCRIHKSLKVTPAMAAGVADQLWEIEDIVKLVDETYYQPKKRGSYKTQNKISN
ncbi:MAG: DDE-type integrase/transposase/recombinase [Rhodomicrobium sp.]|nr:DDE-type integrase/transposase/recombinase [Rhodomicrobium sp.]